MGTEYLYAAQELLTLGSEDSLPLYCADGADLGEGFVADLRLKISQLLFHHIKPFSCRKLDRLQGAIQSFTCQHEAMLFLANISSSSLQNPVTLSLQTSLIFNHLVTYVYCYLGSQ